MWISVEISIPNRVHFATWYSDLNVVPRWSRYVLQVLGPLRYPRTRREITLEGPGSCLLFQGLHLPLVKTRFSGSAFLDLSSPKGLKGFYMKVSVNKGAGKWIPLCFDFCFVRAPKKGPSFFQTFILGIVTLTFGSWLVHEYLDP